MDTEAMERFSRVLALAAEDETHQQLQAFCAALDEPLLGVLEKLPDVDRVIIKEYIRLTGASALRLAEIACERSNP